MNLYLIYRFMRNVDKKYHYLYKTTNLINEKYYYGMHSSNDLNDEYLGSGKRLRYSIRKYGKDNFKREIIKMFDTRKELIQAEIDLITEELLNEKNCMNLKPGGSGGFNNDEHQLKCSINGNIKQNILRKTDIEWVEKTNLKNSNRMKKAYILGLRKKPENCNFISKKHSEETKEKMSEKAKLRTGDLNGSFGTCWITKDCENKKIKKDDLNQYLNQGWSKGRKLK